MESHYIVIGIVLLIIGMMIFGEINNRKKLRKKVRNGWGTWPGETRFDEEESLKESYDLLKKRTKKDSAIDDITWNDLDMFHVFQQINHTYSSIGSEALYRKLRAFDFDDRDQQRMEQLIAHYQNHPRIREEIQYIFAQLGKKDDNLVVYYLTQNKKQKVLNLGFYVLLGILPIIGLILIFTPLSQLGVILAISAVSFNLIYSQAKKMNIEGELASMNYLVQTISVAKKLSKLEHPLNEELRFLLKPLQKINWFSFSFQMKGNSEGEIIFDYLNMLFMLPFISYHFVFNRIKKHEKEAILLWELLGDMEAASAILNYRTVLPLQSQPDFVEGNQVTAEEVYHPLIDEPVVNPLNWQRNTLVSGSNASGKSTYVKSIAINCILAQTIYTCLAESFSFKRGHVLTSMAVEDDVLEGDSYFVAEIKSLKRVLEKVRTHERCYCFIDEILKGTNTVERISASASILNWLSEYPSLAFVATHDIELTEILKAQCDNVHFRENVTNERGIKFDYRLRKGPATSRNAIQLLGIMDFPDRVVSNAKGMASFFDQNQRWVHMKEQRQQSV